MRREQRRGVPGQHNPPGATPSTGVCALSKAISHNLYLPPTPATRHVSALPTREGSPTEHRPTKALWSPTSPKQKLRRARKTNGRHGSVLAERPEITEVGSQKRGRKDDTRTHPSRDTPRSEIINDSKNLFARILLSNQQMGALGAHTPKAPSSDDAVEDGRKTLKLVVRKFFKFTI